MTADNTQLEMFGQPAAAPVNTEDVAEHIAAHARPVEYDSHREASLPGWAKVAKTVVAVEPIAEPPIMTNPNIVDLKGPLRPEQVSAGLTEQQRLEADARIKAQVAMAREQLNRR
jgi:hypothetical protein